MAGWLIEDTRAMDHAPALGIVGAVNQTADPRLADRTGAHGAGLQRHEQGEAGQPVIAASLGRHPDGQDLGMGGGIVGSDRRIAGAGHHLAGLGIDDHGPHGSLARGRSGLRLGEGDAHGRLVMVDHKQHPRRADRSGQASAKKTRPSGSQARSTTGPATGPRKSEAPANTTSEYPSEALAKGPARSDERVAKALARAGVASRRDVERLIAEGRVALNGAVLTTPAVKIGRGDILTVNGAVVGETEPTRVWRYHKPVGLLTAHKDPKNRPIVFDHLPEGLPRVISVGRLDLASEGLLLLTNDGELARALETPSTGWVRRYRARAYGHATQEKLDTLKEGITVEGVRYDAIEAKLDKIKHAAADVDRKGPANIWISVAITEGKNREVRRVLEHLGLKVNRLIRLAYGPFALGTLPVGAAEEVGPRVLREQLAGIIPAENLPRGDKAGGLLLPKGQSPPKYAARAAPRKIVAPAEPPNRKEYKAGWAKPKKKNPAHPPKPSRKKGPPKRRGVDLTYKTAPRPRPPRPPGRPDEAE